MRSSRSSQEIYDRLPPITQPAEPRGQTWDDETVESILPRVAARARDRFAGGSRL